MAITLPKYIRVRRGSYHYQRRYPSKLNHLIETHLFTFSLRLRVDTASEIEVQKAAIGAAEAYDRQLILIANSDPAALTDTQTHAAATDFLRRRGLTAGQYLRVATDPDLRVKEEQTQTQLQADGYDYADWAIPEFEDVLHKFQTGQPLTLKDTVVGAARQMLVNKAKAKPSTLGSLWDAYVVDRGIDPTTRAGQRSFTRWNRWLSLTGDTVINANTLSYINDGLDAYVLSRKGIVSSATLKRELSGVMACLRLANKVHRFGWHLELPRIKKTPSKTRHPLEPTDQIALVTEMLKPNSSIKPKYACAMLLYLQGGMMTSEIGRLLADDIRLDADIPHLMIVNETKTKDRERVVPIVLGRELIAANIDDCIKWIKGSTESTPSATLKKIMRRVTDNPSTSAHCLRHTFKTNGQTAGVSILTIASIAGWADSERKVSAHLQSYGSAGISQSGIVKRLYTDSQLIHEHLLDIKYDEPSNVISIHSRS